MSLGERLEAAGLGEGTSRAERDLVCNPHFHLDAGLTERKGDLAKDAVLAGAGLVPAFPDFMGCFFHPTPCSAPGEDSLVTVLIKLFLLWMCVLVCF